MKYKAAFHSLWVTGATIAGYLVYLTYFSEICPIGFECTQSPSIPGLIWFTSSPIVIKGDYTRKAWQILGVLGVIALVAIEFITNSFCPYCTATHIIGLTLVALTSVRISEII